MKKDDKASISLIKILGICLLIILIIAIMGIGVMAGNSKLTNVKIILSNNYEMVVLTGKTKISEILKENNIQVEEDEVVVPSLEEELSDNKTIKIAKQDEIGENIEVAQTVETISTEELLQSYNPIIEKIEVVQKEIPFETITKEATGTGTTRNQVVQKGENGIKEVTYKVKYQNDVEIERIEISSTIIKEPVNKIIEVKTVQVTSRGSGRVTYVGTGKWSYSAEDLDLLCAITAQECSSSYEGALAVITTACNRTQSSRWKSRGTDPLSQYKAKGQFCYSIDSHWVRRLNGNYPSHVKQAVLDALNGKRNHNYLSFRAAWSHSGEVIGGNAYFNPM